MQALSAARRMARALSVGHKLANQGCLLYCGQTFAPVPSIARSRVSLPISRSGAPDHNKRVGYREIEDRVLELGILEPAVIGAGGDVMWNDPVPGIDWQLDSEPVVSAKDASRSSLQTAQVFDGGSLKMTNLEYLREHENKNAHTLARVNSIQRLFDF